MVPTPMKPIRSAMSVHDEKLGARRGARAMGEVAVGHLVALAGLQDDGATIRQLGVQFAVQHQEHMALLAPMVGQIAGRVFHHAHADVVEGARAPIGLAGLARMLRAFHSGPVRRAKGYVEHQHGRAFSLACACRYAARRTPCARSGSSTLRATAMPPTQRATMASARSRAPGPSRSASKTSSSFSSTSW